MYSVCIYCTLLKVVGYYDLSVLSMSVMGFQKKVWMGGGWVDGWGELYPHFFGFFLTLQSPYPHSLKNIAFNLVIILLMLLLNFPMMRFVNMISFSVWGKLYCFIEIKV